MVVVQHVQLKSARTVTSHATNTVDSNSTCVACKSGKHPLYYCPKFKSLSHEERRSILKEHSYCLNCLRPGHFVRQCQSNHKCKTCQRPHHSLLHVESPDENPSNEIVASATTTKLLSHPATSLPRGCLLMTCEVNINGSTVKARALLDSASSASFISERLAQSLSLSRSPLSARISGVAGLIHKSPLQSVATFTVSPTRNLSKKFTVTAVVVPRVTCDLPQHPISFDPSWKHLHQLPMADPHFGVPSRIDILLGVDVFVDSLLNGRKVGPPGSPVAIETIFGWVLAGRTESLNPHSRIATHHTAILAGDDLLRLFWKTEENPDCKPPYTHEERMVIDHFGKNHTIDNDGRFVVPLPRKPESKQLGESRSQAVRRFFSLERTLHSKGQFGDFAAVMQEYFDSDHAELVPTRDFVKPLQETFYLPMHAVRKDHSTTTKIRAVFDASAKSLTGVSFNDTLLVGPTIHSSLVDVLLRFRMHRIAVVADVSRMYRAVSLSMPDRDYHRFVWRSRPSDPLRDYRMKRVTFGVAASSFAANMSVKQNAINLSSQFPLAAAAVDDSFYVDDCLCGADTVSDAIELQSQLQEMFEQGGFTLRKWNSSDLTVLENVPFDLKDVKSSLPIASPDRQTHSTIHTTNVSDYCNAMHSKTQEHVYQRRVDSWSNQ